MPHYHPAWANLIILYGEESCKHLGEMLAYWDVILNPADWRSFVFLLIGVSEEDLNIPPDMQKALEGSRQLSLKNLEEGTSVDGLANELRRRMAGRDSIAVQCVCAGLEKIPLAPEPLLQLVRDLTHAFVPGSVYTIFYLMLKTARGAHPQQRAFAKALAQAEIPLQYTYLLGNISNRDNEVPKETRWRAVFAELLANGAVFRTLSDANCFSVGFSALNANDSELISIRKTLYAKWLRGRIAEQIHEAEAWSILSQTEVSWRNDHSFLAQWVTGIFKDQVRLPGEAARKNNRILTSLYQREIAAIQPSIQRFYQINCEHDCQAEAEDYCQAHVDKVLKALAVKMNAPSLSIDFIEGIIVGLRGLAASPLAISEPILPNRKFGESANAYCDRCSDLFEQHYAQQSKQRLCRIYAEAMAKALKKVSSFVQRAKDIDNRLRHFELNARDQEELHERKYPKYCKEVQDSILFHGAEFWPHHSEPLYDCNSGEPNDLVWTMQVAGGVEQIKNRLSDGFKGTFSDVVNSEYGTVEGIHSFFGQYLGMGERMFFDLHDAVGENKALYYVDQAFAENPWFLSLPPHSLVIAHTDNVELVNCFPLAGSLKDLLMQEDSRYFSTSQPSPGREGNMKPLFDGSPQAAGISAKNTGEPEPAIEGAPQVPSRELQIVINNRGKYVLTWNWVPNASSAIVKLYHRRELLGTLTPTSVEYNTAKGNCPQGLDVTGFLPYGHVRVELYHANGALYGSRDMAGRKNDVFYRLKPNDKGCCELSVKGAANDLGKAVLCAKGSNGRAVYYPICIPEKAERVVFSGLREMPASSVLQPSPDEDYPAFQAIREPKM